MDGSESSLGEKIASGSFGCIAIDDKPELRQEMRENSECGTVPQIWINNEHIGGCSELVTMNALCELGEMLAEAD